MKDFGELKRVPLREIWSHEANDFTPWLASNIEALGTALDLDLELTSREASVGDFSLDLLAKDLDSSKTVIIENQLSQTDHDHLGKLLTYAAGFDASIVIWVSKEVREEHRQALEWLNQRTDINTQFFAIVVEVLTIDDSNPAFSFKPVVFPNEWQKSERQKVTTPPSFRDLKCQSYFQGLVHALRQRQVFASAQAGGSRYRYYFPSGISYIKYRAAFHKVGKTPQVSACVYMEGDTHEIFFDALETRKAEIKLKFGLELDWDRKDGRKHSTISVCRDGDIEFSDSELAEIREWHIQNLLKLKEVFTPEIERALETTDNGEL